jgi:small neutral amino acid transporter SnatA (MarC family)
MSVIKPSDKLLRNILKIFHSIPITYLVKIMYRNKSGYSLFDVAMPAVIGAGVVTTFAMSQGQHPAIAIAITAVSAIFAVVFELFNAGNRE